MLNRMFFNICAERRQRLLCQIINKRMTSYLNVHRKRFYRKVNILPDEGGYFIQLDQKTVKTPLLNKLCVPTKPLAMAIANEWHMQTTGIDNYSMPLTTICNTVIDNPTKISKLDLVNEILRFLHTDTICCFSEEPERLVQLQNEKWLPVINWCSQRYNVNITSSSNLFTLHQTNETITTLQEELMKHNKWQLNGLQAAIDGIKSFILPMAVVNEQISVEEAVYLSRLETEFQMEKWGKFEQVHDIDKFNQEVSVSAGCLFYQLTSELKDVPGT